MDERNNKKAYLIIGICCVVALVIGLFTGKTIADKRKLAAAQAYIASVQQDQAKEVVQEISVAESTEGAAEVSADEEKDTIDVQAIVEEGRDYYYGINGKTQDDDKAKELFESALAENDANGRALYYLAEIEFGDGNYSKAKEYYEKAVSAGEPLAALGLGQLYQNGEGVDKDYKKAMELYEQAIADGCIEANVGIGDFYQSGFDDHEIDGFKAIEYFEKATTGEEPAWISYAYSSIAYIYRNGQGGVEKNTDKALEYYQKQYDICKSWSATPLRNIANIYADEGEETSAEEWYKKALDAFKTLAEAGNADAMNEIGFMYDNGTGVELDYGKAMEWYEKAVDEGNVEAMANIGFLYEYGNGVDQDFAKAMECYEKAADRGVPVAMNQMGNFYYLGTGIEQDFSKAMEWYEKAADSGNEAAMTNLAYMYHMGIGVEQNYTKAIEWYEKSADCGNALSMNELGSLYFYGEGVKQDYAKALKWFEKSAETGGDATAMENVAFCYENGLGTSVDTAKAKEWQEKAAEAAETN